MTTLSGMNGLVALTAGLLAVSIAAAPAATAQSAVKRGIRVNRDIGVKAWVPNGSVRVIGWDRDSLHVEGTVGAGDTFHFGGNESGAKLGVDDPLPGRTSPPAHLTVYLPRGGQISVRTVSASVEATDASGWFSTVSGNIRVSGKASELQVEALDGSIHVAATAPYARLRTGSGTVTVGGRIEDLVASTVSGPIAVTSAGVARGRFESMTGAILLDAPVGPASSIDVDNHNGSVELRLPTSLAVDVALTSVAGSITNQYDKRAPLAGRQGRGQELSFVTDPKGARIVVRTFRGPILLRGR